MAASAGLTIGGARVAIPQHSLDPDTVVKELGMSLAIQEEAVSHMMKKLELQSLNDFYYLCRPRGRRGRFWSSSQHDPVVQFWVSAAMPVV